MSINLKEKCSFNCKTNPVTGEFEIIISGQVENIEDLVDIDDVDNNDVLDVFSRKLSFDIMKFLIEHKDFKNIKKKAFLKNFNFTKHFDFTENLYLVRLFKNNTTDCYEIVSCSGVILCIIPRMAKCSDQDFLSVATDILEGIQDRIAFETYKHVNVILSMDILTRYIEDSSINYPYFPCSRLPVIEYEK